MQINTIIDSVGNKYCKGCGNRIRTTHRSCPSCGMNLYILYARIRIKKQSEQDRIYKEGQS